MSMVQRFAVGPYPLYLSVIALFIIHFFDCSIWLPRGDQAGVVCRSRVFSSDSNECRLTIADTSCYTVALDEPISLDLRASRIKHIERTSTNERISVGVCLYSVIGDGAPWLITPDIRFACGNARKDRQNNYSAAGLVERPSSS